MAKLYQNLSMKKYNLLYFNFCLYVIIVCFFTSCISSKKIYYVNDLNAQVDNIDSLKKSAIQKVQKGDKVSIIVSCPDPSKTSFLNPFNNQNPGGNASQSAIGFLVDSTGNIDFPLLGKLGITGMTSTEIAGLIKTGLKKYFIDPYVYVTLSGKVYILNGRGGYSVPMNNERLTIFEALAQQGSYESDDKWDEVLVIREENGKRVSAFCDLNSKDIINSPYYYLHNNDVLYIKPGKLSATLKGTTAIRSTIGLVTGVLALFILLVRK